MIEVYAHRPGAFVLTVNGRTFVFARPPEEKDKIHVFFAEAADA